MSKGLLNPLQLAVLLHWNPEEETAPRAPDAKRVLDHWLQQIEHFDPIFAPEYIEAPAMLSELFIEEAGHEGRMARVRDDEHFHHWGLCQHLLAESQRSVTSSAVLSKDFTDLALAVAMRLDPGHYHLSWTEDLRAKAWCVHADACRRLSQADAAQSAVANAKQHARAGTGSAELAARIEKTEASLNWRNNQGTKFEDIESTFNPPLPYGLGDEPSSHSWVS